MSFAGTEGCNPVAYAPYIVAAAMGKLLGLDFPNLLLLMRVLGLIAFTAVVAYAIRVTPTLKWTLCSSRCCRYPSQSIGAQRRWCCAR